jgi:hypothetical protein
VFNYQKKVEIPKEFVLFGHKYTVSIVDDLFEKEDCYGTADEDMKLIRLQNVGVVSKMYEEDGKMVESKIVITPETIAETFFHEVLHIILDATGEEDLSLNERFVNITGKALLEIYLSSVYEKESKQ